MEHVTCGLIRYYEIGYYKNNLSNKILSNKIQLLSALELFRYFRIWVGIWVSVFELVVVRNRGTKEFHLDYIYWIVFTENNVYIKNRVKFVSVPLD